MLIFAFNFYFIAGNILHNKPKIDLDGNNSIKEESLYQGPVPLGYDEYFFRKTGQTISEVVE